MEQSIASKIVITSEREARSEFLLIYRVGRKKTFQLWGCIANKLHYRETSNFDGLMS